jgi:two-component system sensor histidine kinase UhpB
MATRALFQRQYRAALLDYLLCGGESGRARAYALGRRAINVDIGLLQILRVHQDTVRPILQAARSLREMLRNAEASEDFLLEVLASFEMTYRGYTELALSRHAR